MLRVILSLALATGVSVSAIYAADGQTGSNKNTDKYVKTMQQQFNMKDVNKDGKLTWKEFKGSETNAYRLTKLEKMFKAMDTNHTGYVTFEQYKAYWQKLKGNKRAAKTTNTATNGNTTTNGTGTNKTPTNGNTTTNNTQNKTNANW
jgi:Ca2+-binding EF-hand superfamily protein